MQGLLVPPSRTEKTHITLYSPYRPVQPSTVPGILAALSTGNVSGMRYHAMPMI